MHISDPALLKTLRSLIGISQSAMAARLGMDRSYYSRIERGDRPVDVALLAQVAGMADVRIAIIRPSDEGLMGDLSSLSEHDLTIVLRIARLLPSLAPLRKSDLETLIASWSKA